MRRHIGLGATAVHIYKWSKDVKCLRGCDPASAQKVYLLGLVGASGTGGRPAPFGCPFPNDSVTHLWLKAARLKQT